MTESSQPTFEILLDWLEGHLDGAQAAYLSAQVAEGDNRTRSTVRWLQGFLATARKFPAPEPPPIIRQHLRQHFQRWSTARAAMRAEPRRMDATLLFDSRQDLVLAGFRGGGDEAEDVYNLAFTTDVGDLVVDVRRVGNGQLRLDGQVLLGDAAAAPVFSAEVAGPGYTVRTVDGDELGRFTLPQVPAGRCRLEVSNGEIILQTEFDLTA